jgi:hypothetical protein
MRVLIEPPHSRGANSNAKKQAAHPLIELRRIVFARRKTAWATSPLERPRTRESSDEEQTPKRDRAEHGSST